MYWQIPLLSYLYLSSALVHKLTLTLGLSSNTALWVLHFLFFIVGYCRVLIPGHQNSLLRVRWVIGSILHGLGPLSYISFQPVLHDWCNKARGMCYPVCWMVHIKEPLLLIRKSSPCGSSGFLLSLSEWTFIICPTPYNRK